MHLTHPDRTAAVFRTPHGETVTELVGRATPPHTTRHSVARAVLAPGGQTLRHFHPVLEETYHLVAGHGRLDVAGTVRDVGPGDTVLIPPGAPHKLVNTGPGELAMVVVCAPAWSAEDNVFLERWHDGRVEPVEPRP